MRTQSAGADAINAELGEVIAGIAPGRTEPCDITIFGSGGLAFQDLVVAWLAYEAVLRHGVGQRIDLMGQ